MSEEAERQPDPAIAPERLDPSVRRAILRHPAAVLEDPAIMRALVDASDEERGPNIVDLRGIAMDRLEGRLNRLEDTHRTVIAAAYENLAGTQQIHRAALRLLEPVEFTGFLALLSTDLVDMLRVARIRLVLESAQEDDAAAYARLGDVLAVAEPGFIDDYLTLGQGGTPRRVTLRQVAAGGDGLYGGDGHGGGGAIRSEACLRLDFGAGRYPGMLAIGSNDTDQFAANQGTDLLDFLAGVFERAMRRWLA